MDPIAALYATLDRRETPETVAAMARAALPDLRTGGLRGLVERIVSGGVKQRYGWSSMAATFRAPDTAGRQIAKARELALLFLGQTLPESDDPEEAYAVSEALSALIGRTPGQKNFQADRLSRTTRAEVGLTLSRRRYVKLFRLAVRLENKAARMREAAARLDLTLVSKSGLASRLTLKDLGGDAPTAAFIAYYAARMKLRSEFTIRGQQRAFDEFSAALLKLCLANPGTRWFAIAHVFPRADVLARLTDEEKGRLLGIWFDILQLVADRLDKVAANTRIDMASMIVKRGNDSSSWNLLAGAWNRARDHWIALVDALGMNALFDAMLPGKVLRLMAGDVAHWHRISGGGIHPDTLVWRELPKPWLVVRGEETCTRSMVEEACRRHGVDTAKSGWTAPRPLTSVAAFRPTPELVHGVTVANPFFAEWLKDMGAFSGKPLKAKSLD